MDDCTGEICKVHLTFKSMVKIGLVMVDEHLKFAGWIRSPSPNRQAPVVLDSFMEGSGAHLDNLEVSDVWTQEERVL